jgi:hypothetical protein
MSLLLIQQYNADEQVIVARLIEKTMPREISYSETASEYSLHGPRRIQRRKRYYVDNLCKIFYSYMDQTAKLTTKCMLVRFPRDRREHISYCLDNDHSIVYVLFFL